MLTGISRASTFLPHVAILSAKCNNAYKFNLTYFDINTTFLYLFIAIFSNVIWNIFHGHLAYNNMWNKRFMSESYYWKLWAKQLAWVLLPILQICMFGYIYGVHNYSNTSRQVHFTITYVKSCVYVINTQFNVPI